MPIYEYTCRSCQSDFEAIVPASRRDDAANACPKCNGAQVLRKISLMAKPVVREASSAREASCESPSCCGGRCAIN